MSAVYGKRMSVHSMPAETRYLTRSLAYCQKSASAFTSLDAVAEWLMWAVQSAEAGGGSESLRGPPFQRTSCLRQAFAGLPYLVSVILKDWMTTGLKLRIFGYKSIGLRVPDVMTTL